MPGVEGARACPASPSAGGLGMAGVMQTFRATGLSAAMAMGLAGSVAQAQVITDCSRVADPAHIMEPWSRFSRTFANGNIRITLLDTFGEPTCCAAHLLILAPSGSPEWPEHRQCHVASDSEGRGFSEIEFDRIEASYDPRLGLLVEVPWHRYVDGRVTQPGVMRIRINQATGDVGLE